MENALKEQQNPRIEFVSYTGEYPTLCHGVLTVKINNTEYKFGHEPMSYDFSKHCWQDGNLPTFWKSGGECGFGVDENGYTDYSNELVDRGDWELADCIEGEFPEDIKTLLPEILKCMNENVPLGCCGGCI